ncbi:MAG: transporter ATP-binding protein [Marmoricola sp.]|nr:transporter ATP-binding protein [Marmoricola sp.]
MRILCSQTKVVGITSSDDRPSEVLPAMDATHERRGADPAVSLGGLELSSVTVTYGGLTALCDVSLTVSDHQVHGVIGPNGAGKTTLFNVACGFTTPDHGTLAWRGRELGRLRPHDLAGLGIARTMQGVGLFDRMSVLENVMVGADTHAHAGFLSSLLGARKSTRDESGLRTRAFEILERLAVTEYADRRADSLPYPVRKRVALARALACEPDLLLLDEPASGLSHDEIDELGELVRGLTGEMSVLLVEHHMDLVMRVCDQITVLDFGRVIAQGPPEAVRDDPAVLAAYLGDATDEGS